MFVYTAFVIGIVSSFHCIGMCGPIALGATASGKHCKNPWLMPFFYNVGRVLTYTLLGLIVGALGRGIVLSSSQQLLSILIGIVLLAMYALPKVITRQADLLRVVHKGSRWFKQRFHAQLYQKKIESSIFRGMLNGFLPCGSVYLALAGAIATGSIGQGVLYMFFFGLGTFPLMFLITWAGNRVKPKTRHFIYKKATPVIAITLACVFIVRGLNLNIPYLSPKISKSGTQIECCEVETPK
ncbi:hypothetical protein BKI52_06690 [marine bacterium AO1-C]|nr:hypothetical protein BKI52_06690 [marine bacterium AO1-C]